MDPGSRRKASPPRGQDAVLVGVTLDAAHTHGVSVGKRARPQQVQAGPPLGSPQERSCHTERWPHSGLPVAGEHRCGRCPGVPAFQNAVIPTCAEREIPIDHGTITASGRSSGREFTSVRKFPGWGLFLGGFRWPPGRRAPGKAAPGQSPLCHRNCLQT